MTHPDPAKGGLAESLLELGRMIDEDGFILERKPELFDLIAAALRSPSRVREETGTPAKEGLAKRLLALADLGGMSNDDVRDLRQAAGLIASRVREETIEARTLRDWFAGMALAEVPDPTNEADAPTTARLAYAIADAMMKERSLKAKGAGQ